MIRRHLWKRDEFSTGKGRSDDGDTKDETKYRSPSRPNTTAMSIASNWRCKFARQEALDFPEHADVLKS